MGISFVTLTSYHYAKVMDWLTGLIADLTGSAVKVLMRIAKQTFGFRKWEDVISLSQFEAWCGIDHTTAIRTVDALLALRLIRRVRSGKGFCYALNVPADLFVDKSSEVIHNDSAQVSFFTQNPATSPQTEQASVGKSDTQIKDVTGNNWKEQELLELLATFDAINSTATACDNTPIRFLPRWVARARALGMAWSDLYTLWCACVRVGRNPPALFLSRLMGDGTPPTARQPRQTTPRRPTSPQHAEFYTMLRSA